MRVYPLLDVFHPASKENEVIREMDNRASEPWSSQSDHPVGRPVEDGSYFFHRSKHDTAPPCTVCLHRVQSGHLQIVNIVPDEGVGGQIPIDTYVSVLNEFDTLIASPAAEHLEGFTVMGTSEHRLEDHFSPHAMKLLKGFCKTSNVADRGSHLSDQRKWISFLLHIHRHGETVHCDTFGACLKATRWWPEDGIADLVEEYDFASRLLRQADEE